MSKCFFRTCLLLVLALLSSAAQSHAQRRFSLDPGIIHLGTVAVGDSARGSFWIGGGGNTSRINPIYLTQITSAWLKLDSIQLYPRFIGPTDSIEQAFTVRPTSARLDTLKLAMIDSLFLTDTVLIVVNAVSAFPPFEVNHHADIGPYLVGAPVLDSFYIRSVDRTIRPEILFADSHTRDLVVILSQLPELIQAGDSALVRLRITNDSLGPQHFTLLIRDTISQSIDSAEFSLIGIPPTPVDSVFALREAGKDVFAKIVTTDTATFAILGRNITDSLFIIQQIIHDNAPHFKVESALPIVLQPGEAFDLIMRLTTSQEGFYPTVVRVPNDGGLASEYSITIQVLRIAPSSVPPVVSHNIRVSQSSTSIAIEGLTYERGVVELFDVIGRPALRHEHQTSPVLLPRLSRSGKRLSDGAYLLRLSSIEGKQVTTIKLILSGF